MGRLGYASKRREEVKARSYILPPSRFCVLDCPIINKSTKVPPQDRYASVEDFAEDINSFEEPVLAREDPFFDEQSAGFIAIKH